MKVYERVYELKKAFKSLRIESLVQIYNQYCFINSNSELIFDMRDINDMLGQTDVYTALRNAYLGEFNFADKYVYELRDRKYLYSFSDVNDKNFVRIFDAEKIAKCIAELYVNVEDMTTGEILSDLVSREV